MDPGFSGQAPRRGCSRHRRAGRPRLTPIAECDRPAYGSPRAEPPLSQARFGVFYDRGRHLHRPGGAWAADGPRARRACAIPGNGRMRSSGAEKSATTQNPIGSAPRTGPAFRPGQAASRSRLAHQLQPDLVLLQRRQEPLGAPASPVGTTPGIGHDHALLARQRARPMCRIPDRIWIKKSGANHDRLVRRLPASAADRAIHQGLLVPMLPGRRPSACTRSYRGCN